MKALIVGYGSIGRRHARNWVRLGLGEVAVVRRAATAAEPLELRARVFDDLDEALADRPDVVIVANPTSLHAATALAAVRAGCHALVEKPLDASLDHVADLLAEADARRRRLFVAYHLRCHPLLTRARALLLDGAIGRPLTARAEAGEYLPDWHPGEDYRLGYSARRALGGGPILTLSHELDALCWLLGRPVSVGCLAGHVSGLELDTEDVAEIGLRFASGAIGSVHVDYLRRPPRRSLEVVGEAGVLRWEYDENRLLVYAPATRQWRVEQGDPAFARNDLYLEELRHVAACVRADVEPPLGHPSDPSGSLLDHPPLADGRQGAAILAVALAAHRAAAEGRAIDLDQATQGAQIVAWLNSLSPSPSSSASTAA
jgi:predicted dehydrogenase